MCGWIKFCGIFLFTCSAASVSGQYIPKFDVQGHRGARGLAPENTRPAFITALDLGVTTIELDVVITADQQVLVSHEPWISAGICLNKDGTPINKNDEKSLNIFHMNYEDVIQYDCGSKPNPGFPDQKKLKVSKPLLQDVIIAVEDHIRSYTQYEVDYNIEIKSTIDGDDKFHPTPEVFSELVYNLVDQFLPMNRVVFQSFDVRVLKYLHKKYPSCRLALLVSNLKSVSRNLAELGFNPSAYSPSHKLVSNAAINYLHARKIRVIPWTVNDEDRIKKLKTMGVDGVITDYPDKTFQLGLGVKRPVTGKSGTKNQGQR